MRSKERVLTALNHQEPDRVPFDLSGTVDTGIHREAYANLREYLGLESSYDPMICETLQQVVRPEEEVLRKLNVDTGGVMLSDVHSLPSPEVTEEKDRLTFTDPFGVRWKKPLPDGLYFDIIEHPLDGELGVEELEGLELPDPTDPRLIEDLKKRAREVARNTDRAVILAANDAGILERAEWMRGFKGLFEDLHRNPDRASLLLDKLTKTHVDYWETVLDEVGHLVDVVVEADDLGTQDRPLLNPKTYRSYIKPRHKEIIDSIKRTNKNVSVFFHSCGAVREFIPDMIEIGVDALNPVQVSATGMDTKELKIKFGKDIAFWGGGVDTQNILPNGSPREVKNEVKKRIEDMASGGGMVFSAVHNIQADVPPENILAMVEALHDYGAY